MSVKSNANRTHIRTRRKGICGWPVCDPVIRFCKMITFIRLQIDIKDNGPEINMCLEIQVTCLAVLVIIIINKREVEPDIQAKNAIIKPNTQNKGIIGMIDQILFNILIPQRYLSSLH